MTASLCMIVKNEEKVLGRCLSSVSGCFDEIVIVDTGSNDRTKEIASLYTDRVYDFTWKMDFSAARNYAFSLASGDLLMWLDADDVLTEENRERLAELIRSFPDGSDAVMMKYETGFDESGKATFWFYRERLFRRTASPLWQGRVHETVSYTGATRYTDIAVTHRSEKTVYSDRNLRIYEDMYRAGDAFSARDLFYYARELYYHKDYPGAKRILDAFFSLGNGWVENKVEGCRIYALCEEGENDIPAALASLFRTFSFTSPRAEILCEIGRLLMAQSRYADAVFWYTSALSLKPDETGGGFIDENAYGYLPAIQLAVCYDRLGNRNTACRYNKLAGSFSPASPAYLYNLEYFRSIGADTQDSDTE